MFKSILQNKIFINFLFFILIFISGFYFIKVFNFYEYDFYIPHFGALNPPVKVNVEINDKEIQNFHFFVNGVEISPYRLYKENSYAIYEVEKFPVFVMYFKTDTKKTLDDIENIVIHLGKNMFFYDNLKIKNFKISPEGYIILPSDIKYAKNGKYVNDKGALHRFFTYSMSIFYNTVFFVVPLIFLALAAGVWASNKEKFNFNFTLFKNSAIWLIILLGAILRLQDLQIPFWGDELYTAVIAGGAGESWIKTFQDPGNPPLFFILAKIWTICFGNSEAICRLLPLIFSVLTIPAVYAFVKRNSNQNLAIFSAFLFAINAYSIHSAQEFRCYSLCILFAVISAYYLFEIIKYKKNRDFIIYGITAILMANTHYFLSLVLINNFILAMFFLDNKSRLKFFFANFAAFLALLPYLILTGFKKGLLDLEFNKLPNYDLAGLWATFFCFWGNRLIAFLMILLSLLIGIPKTREFLIKPDDKKPVILLLYAFYAVFALYVSSLCFSHLVRPITRAYYFIEVLAFLSIFTASVFAIQFKNKILRGAVCLIFLLFSVFCITGVGTYINKDDVLVIRVEELFKYSCMDSPRYNKKTAVAMFDFVNYSNYYKDFIRQNTVFIPYKFGVDTPETFNQKLVDSKAGVIYSMLHKMRAWEFIEEFSKNYTISAVETDKGIILVRMIKN